MKDKLFGIRLEYLAIGVVLGIIVCGIILKSCRHQEPKLNNCDSVVVKHDTVYVESEEDKVIIKPLPALTKFKVSDWVCAWGKWSGVVNEIKWANNETILQYRVQHYNEADQEFDDGWYFDTELEPGKCH